MNKFEHWILNKLINKVVEQGPHNQRIVDVYKLIRIACEHEFYEDSTTTLNSNLTRWFQQSLRKPTI